jgi:hypothetical protein
MIKINVTGVAQREPYLILEAGKACELQEKVKPFLAMGYVPQGGVSKTAFLMRDRAGRPIVGEAYAQALALKEARMEKILSYFAKMIAEEEPAKPIGDDPGPPSGTVL